MFSLDGKKALITGASRGIGAAIAAAYARSGADVALVARSADGLEATADTVRDAGRKAVVLPADVTDSHAVAEMVDAAVAGLGGLDIVVNNAGGSRFVVTFSDLRMSGWEKVLRLNLDATVYVCQAAGKYLTGQGSGTVINVASVAGLASAPLLAPYGAAKAAVINLTKTLAVEWAAAGVRVNALCPGWTATDLNRNMWESPDGGHEVIKNVPMGRWGRAEEMAGPAVFLASEASSFMTGQVVVIDGGQSATAS
jgi:NAD(P)-dependent dehydrogenase (short-subunit alcohol dehydrogenase family)